MWHFIYPCNEEQLEGINLDIKAVNRVILAWLIQGEIDGRALEGIGFVKHSLFNLFPPTCVLECEELSLPFGPLYFQANFSPTET